MKKHLRFLGVIALLFLILGVIAFSLISFSSIHAEFINQISRNQQIRTEYAATQIAGHVFRVRDELVTLSKFPVIESIGREQCSRGEGIVHLSSDGAIEPLLRVAPDGTVAECSSPVYANYLGLNVRNKPYFRIPKETSESYIIAERDGNSERIFVAVPLFETTSYTPYPNFVGNFKGILLSIIDLQNLVSIYLSRVLEPENSLYVLLDRESQSVMLKSKDLNLDNDFVQRLLDNSGFAERLIPLPGNGDAILSAADIRIGSLNWRLVILTPLSAISSQFFPIKRNYFLSLTLISFLIAVLLFFLVSFYRAREEAKSKLAAASISLEKLGISIDVESAKFSQADIDLPPKAVYLVRDDKENHSHEFFISCLNKGCAGLGIVRDNPKNMRRRYGLLKTSFLWLSQESSKDVPSETDINALVSIIKEFAKKSPKSVILIDSFDYLFAVNKREDVIRAVYAFRDIVALYDSIIIIGIDPDIISEGDLKVLESQTVDLYGRHLKERVALSKMEKQILNFINDMNVNNTVASFKDITAEFGITKPTTRKKVERLQLLGLVEIEKRGRTKSLKITSLGRRLLREA